MFVLLRAHTLVRHYKFITITKKIRVNSAFFREIRAFYLVFRQRLRGFAMLLSVFRVFRAKDVLFPFPTGNVSCRDRRCSL